MACVLLQKLIGCLDKSFKWDLLKPFEIEGQDVEMACLMDFRNCDDLSCSILDDLMQFLFLCILCFSQCLFKSVLDSLDSDLSWKLISSACHHEIGSIDTSVGIHERDELIVGS